MSPKSPDNRWRAKEHTVWQPAEDLSISQWAETYRVLTAGSEERGPLRLRRTPYAKAILDMCLTPGVDEVVWMASAQIAKTETALSVAGFFAHQEAAPIGLVLADENTAKYVASERLQKVFEDSPELAESIDSKMWNKSEMKLTNGAYMAAIWASSVAGLGTKPFKVMILDEVDKPGYYAVSKEASALSLARERKESFYNSLVFIISTPTLETGNICRELDSCDVIYDWHVPCPQCGIYQPLRWSRKYTHGFKAGKYRDIKGKWRKLGQVEWRGGRDANQTQLQQARYVCGNPKCKAKWATMEKNFAVEQGQMVPRRAGSGRKIGFHINRLYSLLGRSGDISKLVGEHNMAIKSGDPKKLQGFINGTLAEPWKEVVIKVRGPVLLQARVDLEPQTVPEQAVALICAVDPRKYGFWYVVRAWAKDFTSWLIHYGSLAEWDDVYNLLFETRYVVSNSDRTMGIWRAAIDTGGGAGEADGASMTEQAYSFIRQYGTGLGCRVWGTKGAARPLAGKLQLGKALDKTPRGRPIPGGLQLVSLDTHELKDLYHYRLAQAIKQEMHAAYLHKAVGNDYARQIMAEEKRLNEKGLQVWHQTHSDNHYLDCEAMVMAVADPEWPGGGVNLIKGQINSKEAADDDGKTGDAQHKPVMQQLIKQRKRKKSAGNWMGGV